MNLIILHGDDFLRSQKRLNIFIDEAIKRKWKVQKLSLSKNIDFKNNLNKNSLFNENILYIVENMNLLNKNDFNWLNNGLSNEKTIVFYGKGKLSNALLNKFPKYSKIEYFEQPKIIFEFLSSLFPGNGQHIISLFNELSKNNPIEFIFIMLTKHFRDLYWVSKEPSEIPYPSWKVFKLEQQSGKYTPNILELIINQLSKIDVKVKTSNANLKTELSLLFIKYLT